MYEYISGEIAELKPTYAIIEAHGVGYYLNISLQTFSQIENLTRTKLYTHFIVREDAQILYGFFSAQEREHFRLLLSVSGVGGNTARMILSTYAPRELANIITSENATLLKNVKGLGLKTAQKIIVELKDKIIGETFAAGENAAFAAVSSSEETFREGLAALSMLGFGKSASEKILRNIIKEHPTSPVEDIIRMSLKKL